MKKINCKLRVPFQMSDEDVAKLLAALNDKAEADGCFIERVDPPSDIELDYVSTWLYDLDESTLRFSWSFDELQAEPYHHNFSKAKLLDTLRKMVVFLEKNN